MTLLRPFLLASAVLVLPASAQSYLFDIQPAQSNATLGAGFGLELPGSLIGDWDAVSNPTGTQTLPGLFGGSGNNPIPVDLGLDGTTQLAGNSTGRFGLTADVGLGLVTLSGLELDLLGGANGSADLSVDLLFSTFRTVNPGSLFIGGFPLSLPLGSADLSDLLFSQNGPGAGTLTATAVAGVYDVAALVPGELSFLVDFAGNPTPVGPVPFALPLSGQLTLSGATASFSLSAMEMVTQTLPDPLPGVMIDDIPLPLPTLLPPGGTANLLVSFGVDELTFQANLGVTLTALGALDCGIASYCVGEPNSTGAGASLSTSGSTSIAANDLVLEVSGLPTEEFGYFLMGQEREDLPGFAGGVGRMCIGPGPAFFRNDVQATGQAGAVAFALDLTDLPSGTVVAAGEHWNFQFWYRDQFALGGATTNTSDALDVAFCQ